MTIKIFAFLHGYDCLSHLNGALPKGQQLAGHNHIDVAIVETAVVVVLVQIERGQRKDVGRARQCHCAQTVAKVNVVLLGDGGRVAELGEAGACDEEDDRWIGRWIERTR